MSYQDKLKEGISLLEEGDYDYALDVSQRLQKTDPNNSDGFHLEAMVFQKLNQWERSVHVLDMAINLNDQKSEYFNLRGFARLQMNDLDEAQKDLKKAIDLDDSPSAHRNLVLYKIMSDRGNEAMTYLLDRIRNNPKDVENWILMGDLMQRAGQKDKALTYYQQARKMDPDNEYVQKQLAGD